MALIVEDACIWKPMFVSIDELYNYGSQKVIGSKPDFLQRKVQKDEWTKNDNKRIKSYLRSLVMGNGDVDFFMIAPLELVIQSLTDKMNDTSIDKSEIENIKPILKVVQQDKKDKMDFYVVDGQNRLFEALIPFFENRISFGTKEKVAIIDEEVKGSKARMDLTGKYFKDLSSEVKEFLKEIEVPLATAEQGNIDSITDALIAKNTNVAWNEWQRIRIKNTFTTYNGLVNSVMETEDGGILAEKLFNKLGTKNYDYEKDGWEKFISEMLIWMETKKQPHLSSNDGHEPYFTGRSECKMSKSKPGELKKYLREFSQCSYTKNTQHMMVRNYVMFRYAIDHPKEFKIDIPSWEIKNGPEFAAQFVLAAQALHKDKNAMAFETPQSKKKRKVEGYYPWANSEYLPPEFIERRLTLLSEYFTDNLGEKLIEKNTVAEYDRSPMPSMGEVYSEKKQDHKGNDITALDIMRNNFQLGHKIPRSKGGKNTVDNLEIQNVKSNQSYGNIEVTN